MKSLQDDAGRCSEDCLYNLNTTGLYVVPDLQTINLQCKGDRLETIVVKRKYGIAE